MECCFLLFDASALRRLLISFLAHKCTLGSLIVRLHLVSRWVRRRCVVLIWGDYFLGYALGKCVIGSDCTTCFASPIKCSSVRLAI
jgi:hypothetical protein